MAGHEDTFDAPRIKAIREATGLTQKAFATLLEVNLGTLRHWEQGRRLPTGPARALLRALENDRAAVQAALAAQG
ncbi:helix-turn-helix domain-containing protein [Gallaecimonas kandeliae]|uniref:helix-turn-helix domain-containing protein n=1 Tax=Gallaecimonas kandeliae TaxID=3029055 RepID=UPI0026493A3E|nr:helix-turn-helix domain-containing protein [Gallaecimonas kandeliae]WKE65106.1 helix-turn-helix domain-containing protein [Gallaecimonas kandeliae]